MGHFKYEHEFIVRYYEIDEEGVYRKHDTITRTPGAYLTKYEIDKSFVLVSIEPIDYGDRIMENVKAAKEDGDADHA